VNGVTPDLSPASRWLPAALLLAVLALGIGLGAGSAGWGWPGDDIVWRIRLPRVLAGFGSGAALALSGTLMQLLTRNALADPSVLGVSGGAGVGALLAMLVAPLAALPAALGPMLGAALGAAGAASLLLALSWRALAHSRGLAPVQEGTVTLLLLGVMIGSGCAALISLLLALAPGEQLRGMVFWLLGDLNGATHWVPVWVAVGLALLLVVPRAHELDAMARGDAWSRTLGVAVTRRRRTALVAAALATGAAVATAGAIGFVGLVVPHALRLLGVRSAPALLPASAFVGGAFVVAVDTLARTLLAPTQLPVGVFAAGVGVPLFVTLLLRGPVR
jgi:iron complex transport system permease protein